MANPYFAKNDWPMNALTVRSFIWQVSTPPRDLVDEVTLQDGDLLGARKMTTGLVQDQRHQPKPTAFIPPNFHFDRPSGCPALGVHFPLPKSQKVGRINLNQFR